MKYIWQAIFK